MTTATLETDLKAAVRSIPDYPKPGIVFRDILRRSGVRRAVVAGGDTSGHVTNQLGLYALSYRAALVRGCPLCLTHSERPEFDGRELALKGGQMGGESFFSQVRAGMP